jgi:hypothetical protein
MRHTSSADTAAAFRLAFSARKERERRRPRALPKRWTLEATTCLREVMLDHIGRWPRARAAIFAAVRDDFGGLDIRRGSRDLRRLERALRWLLEAGKVVRVAGGYRRDRVQEARAA